MDQKLKATIAVICGDIIFGFSFLFSRLALDVTEPSVLIATRFTTAFVVMSLVIVIGRRMKKRNGEPLVRFSLKGKPKRDVILMVIFQPIVYFVAENYGIVYTSSAFAGIIISTIPLAGILCDVLIMHSRVTKVQLICAIVSVIGVGLTSLGARDMHSSLGGLVILLIAVLSASMFYVFSKRSAAYYSSLERTYIMFGCGAAAFIVFAGARCMMVGTRIVTDAFASPMFWAAVLYLACVSSVLAFLLLNYGSGIVSITQATMYSNVTTVISIIAGVTVLHEAFSMTQLIGAIIIIAGVYIAQLSGRTGN